ncbi:MAG: HlyD family secretion protein [Gemmataceae bacterium]|nr:HlyD family secretion protein [Gemmataceae bacterium]
MTHLPAAEPAWIPHEPHDTPLPHKARLLPPLSDKRTEPPARKGFFPWRLVRAALAVALSALLLWWLLVPLLLPVTSRAVVNARTAQVRSPIDGVNAELAGEVGDRVEAGQTLLRVTNSQVDTSHLAELRTRASGLEARRARAAAEIEEGRKAAPVLRRTVERYQRAVREGLEKTLEVAKARVAASRIGLDAVKARMERIKGLARTRTVSPAESEDVQEALAKTRKELDKDEADLSRLTTELEAARKGVFLQHEASYAMKRADEAEEKVAAASNTLKEVEAQLASARTQLAAETERVEGLKDMEVPSPVAGTVWRRAGNPGQVVKQNEVVYEVADHGTVFVEALFHQRCLGCVAPGAKAHIRLTSGQALAGTVRAVRTLGEGEAEAAHAIRLSSTDMKQVRVLIALDEPCRDASLIGRHARVLLTCEEPSWLENAAAWVFARVGV